MATVGKYSLSARGLKNQFFGVVLAVVGLAGILYSSLMYGEVDGIDLLFIAAGLAVFVFGAVQKKKDARTP